MDQKKVLIALSGGLDSTTLVGHLLDRGYKVHCISFDYGSKHNDYERVGAIRVAQFYKLKLLFVDMAPVMVNFKSNLLMSGGDIPEGHYEDESMSLTVVPARNLIFLSIMAGLAESMGIKNIALGIHSGDHAIYPDCRPDFLQSAQTTIKLATGGKVDTIIAPFINRDKCEIIQCGMALPEPAPYFATRTCYKNQADPCGKCGSCVERLEAFAKAGHKDPVYYAPYSTESQEEK